MKLSGISLALLAITLSPALADEVELGEEEVFYLDEDGDGAISGPEYDKFAKFAFRTMDKNSSGTLSAREVSPYLSLDDFANMDSNGDGRVTRKEYAQQLNADFAAADKNGDGLLN